MKTVMKKSMVDATRMNTAKVTKKNSQMDTSKHILSSATVI